MDLNKLYKHYLVHPDICTDTRQIKQGCIFFALKGENFDGNKFAHEAILKGASMAVVDDKKIANNINIFFVKDVLSSLQDLAKMHRKNFQFPVLALTGSNGKTTTKELCREVLSRKYIVSATRDNLNNHIGVPISILDTDLKTEMLILEMGANHQGEIDTLCHLGDPDFGMITNIGKAHLEGFGGIEGVKKGKSEMYRYLNANNKKIFVNTDDSVLMGLIPVGSGLIKYSALDLEIVKDDSNFIAFKYKNRIVRTQLSGSYNLPNIAFAIATGGYFEVNFDDIIDAIQSYCPDNNRSQLEKIGSNTFLKDAYNANPSSMRLSIENIGNSVGLKKVLVLGDMLELGEYTLSEHTDIIDLTQQFSFFDRIFVGKHFCEAGRSKQGNYFENIEEAKKYFLSQNYQNCFILLKGSRGIAVEKIIQ